MEKRKDVKVFIIGFMGVGKSTVSKVVAEKTNIRVFDTDKMVEMEEDLKVSEIFKYRGEEAFRMAEKRALMEICHEKGSAIVSCGGGIVLRDENVRMMKKAGKILLLEASPSTIYEHVKDSKKRPLLNGNMNVQYIGELMAQREDAYRKAADEVINVDGGSVEKTSDRIINVFGL